MLLLTALRTCSGRHLAELQVMGTVPAFSLQDQSGQPVTEATLRGRPWVASFVFTTCSTVCPKITEANVELQRRLTAAGRSARIVSFTVDPEYDTPEVLAAYAARYGADPARWSFLTGPQDRLFRLITDGFQLAMGDRQKDAAGVIDITHSSKLVLVDATLQVRGYFGTSPEEIGLIVAYLEQLEAAAPAPTGGP